MQLMRKCILIFVIIFVSLLTINFGFNRIFAGDWNDQLLIAKGGGHHGGHHHGHHHHGHHHHHPHHHHHHGHHHHHPYHHHYGHHPYHHAYWYGGNGGVWGNQPGYVYDPNYYYNVNGTPSIPYNELLETPNGSSNENNILIKEIHQFITPNSQQTTPSASHPTTTQGK